MKFLFASALACQVSLVLTEPVADDLSNSLSEDSECVAPSGAAGQKSQCALNALQHRAKKIDLESGEGADLIEAARAFYSANTTAGSQLGAKDGIPPPKNANEHNGISWPTLKAPVNPGEPVHIFAIGDWGGMDGALNPPDGFPRMITYPGGHLPGPHVFPRSRLACTHDALTNCYFNGKKWCNPSCGYMQGVDDKAQLLVAEQFKKRAAIHNPAVVFNVGDNFYWGGIAKTCGTVPMNQINWATKHQFDSIFEGVYNGPGIDGKKWLSVLGNHDWGGRMFSAGWDQQMAYTWASDRWMMPALYWHQPIEFPGFTMDVYMVDSNHNDARWKALDKEHNICGMFYNKNGATCASAGGPRNLGDCLSWFKTLWSAEQAWLTEKIPQSQADWQIIVTHFPCDSTPGYWRSLHGRGLDLLVTGHRHDQETVKPFHRNALGGLACIVTGGGGGISSEDSPLPGHFVRHNWPNVDTQYGFFDFAVTKETISVESIDWKGNTVNSMVVHPSRR